MQSFSERTKLHSGLKKLPQVPGKINSLSKLKITNFFSKKVEGAMSENQQKLNIAGSNLQRLLMVKLTDKEYNTNV